MIARARPGGPAALIVVLAVLAAAIARSEEPRPPGGPAADSLDAAAESLAAPLDTLAAPLPSPATFLWDALAATPGTVTLAPRAVGEADPLSAAHLLESFGLLEMTRSGAPAGVPEWAAHRGLGPGWIDLRVDGLRLAPGHSAAPRLDTAPLEAAGGFLWVPGPMAVLAGTGAAGGALLVRTPDDRFPRARSLAAASLRYYDTNTGALSFHSANGRQGLGFDYSDRATGGREAYGRSWTRTFGGRASRFVTGALRAAVWGHGFEGRTRLYDGSKLERRGRVAAAGLTRSAGPTSLSLSVEGAREEFVATTSSGMSRRRGNDLGVEAALRDDRGALVVDAAGGLVREHATWRDRGLAAPSWESTRLWAAALASSRPGAHLELWGGARWERESAMRTRVAPAVAVQWTLGAARIWAAASRGFGEAAYPSASNDLRTLTLQGLGLLVRGGRVSLPEVRRVEAGAALGSPGEDRWARATVFAADVRNAFVGSAIGEAGPPSGLIASGALDSLRGDAGTVGLDAAARSPIVWGFYARGRGLIVRDRDGGDPALWVYPPESALAALGLRRLLFGGDLVANAEIIGRFRGAMRTPFVLQSADGPVRVDLDAAAILSFRLTGDVDRRFHLFYEVENLLNERAGSRTFVEEIGSIYLPGRNYTLGILWRLLD